MDFEQIMTYYHKNKAVFYELSERYMEDDKTGKKIVPFVGAGLSSFCYPMWGKVLLQLNDKYGGAKHDHISQLIKEYQYEKAAAEIALIGDEFYDELRDIFGNKSLGTHMPKIVYQSVQILPFLFPNSLLITTNYDPVLEYVYSNVRLETESAYTSTPTEFENLSRNIHENNVSQIYKAHGDIYSANEDIVFTTESYNRHYNPNTLLVSTLKRVFAERSMLFLGASLFKDRTLDILQLVKAEKTIHYAIVNCDKEHLDERYDELYSKYNIKSILFPSEHFESVGVILKELYNKCHGGYLSYNTPNRNSERHFVMTDELRELFYEDINFDIFRTDNREKNEKQLQEYEEIIKNYSASIWENSIDEDEAIKYANTIFNLILLEPSKMMTFVDEAFRVFCLHSDNDDISSMISATLYNAIQSVNRDDASYLHSLIKRIFKIRPQIDTISTYANSLNVQIQLLRNENLELCASILNEIKEIGTRYIVYDTRFHTAYSMALFNYHLGCYSAFLYDECTAILDELHALQKSWPRNERVAHSYSRALLNTIEFGENDIIQYIVDELKRLDYDFREDKILSLMYVSGLRAQALKLSVGERLHIVNKIDEISNFYSDHKEIQSERKRAWGAYFDALSKLTPNDPDYIYQIIHKLHIGETVDLTPRKAAFPKSSPL